MVMIDAPIRAPRAKSVRKKKPILGSSGNHILFSNLIHRMATLVGAHTLACPVRSLETLSPLSYRSVFFQFRSPQRVEECFQFDLPLSQRLGLQSLAGFQRGIAYYVLPLMMSEGDLTEALKKNDVWRSVAFIDVLDIPDSMDQILCHPGLKTLLAFSGSLQAPTGRVERFPLLWPALQMQMASGVTGMVLPSDWSQRHDQLAESGAQFRKGKAHLHADAVIQQLFPKLDETRRSALASPFDRLIQNKKTIDFSLKSDTGTYALLSLEVKPEGFR